MVKIKRNINTIENFTVRFDPVAQKFPRLTVFNIKTINKFVHGLYLGIVRKLPLDYDVLIVYRKTHSIDPVLITVTHGRYKVMYTVSDWAIKNIRFPEDMGEDLGSRMVKAIENYATKA